MVSPGSMRTEMEILGEKIETFEHLVRTQNSPKSAMENFLKRKLREYRNQFKRMQTNYSFLCGAD